MRKYKQAAVSIAILTIIFSAGSFANAGSGNDNIGNDQNNFVQKYSSQQEQILTAFENQDYQTWRKILAKNKKNNINLSYNDFKAFIQARQHARFGNYNQALKISQRLKSELKNKIPSAYKGALIKV